MEPEDRELILPEGEDEKLQLSSEDERAAVIASVLRDQAEREEARESTPLPGPKPLLPQLSALAVSTAFAVYVWFGSPGWLEPDPIPLTPVAVEESTVRAVIFLQAQKIEDYRERYGRLPAFLEEAGPGIHGVRYRRLDGQTYRIHGQGDRVGLSYTSGEPLAEFLGSGEGILAGALNQ
ncbi:hypothetical protein ACFL0I_04160 [Gemmatimonadota bacterium]